MMGIATIDPRDMDVLSWTAATGFTLDTFGPIQVLLDPKDWQRWGATILGLASLSGIILPDPFDFVDWRLWAMRFNEVLEGRS